MKNPIQSIVLSLAISVAFVGCSQTDIQTSLGSDSSVNGGTDQVEKTFTVKLSHVGVTRISNDDDVEVDTAGVQSGSIVIASL